LGGDECSDFKNPIGRTFLSGTRIFAETGKSRLSVKRRPVGGELQRRISMSLDINSTDGDKGDRNG
jgi:hypothetical protein